MFKITETIKHIIIINILFFIASIYFKGFDLYDILALHYPHNPKFGFWQYLSYMFLHDKTSIFHLTFNMYGLFAFGAPLEQIWGRNKFLFFYFSTGIGAGLIYTLANYIEFQSIYNELLGSDMTENAIENFLQTTKYNPFLGISEEKLGKIYELYHTPAVGASGAIYGILVAFGMLFPESKLALIFLPIPIAAKYFIPIILVMDLFFGITNYSIGNIAHFAHLGGAFFGFVMAFYWKKNNFTRWD